MDRQTRRRLQNADRLFYAALGLALCYGVVLWGAIVDILLGGL